MLNIACNVKTAYPSMFSETETSNFVHLDTTARGENAERFHKCFGSNEITMHYKAKQFQNTLVLPGCNESKAAQEEKHNGKIDSTVQTSLRSGILAGQDELKNHQKQSVFFNTSVSGKFSNSDTDCDASTISASNTSQVCLDVHKDGNYKTFLNSEDRWEQDSSGQSNEIASTIYFADSAIVCQPIPKVTPETDGSPSGVANYTTNYAKTLEDTSTDFLFKESMCNIEAELSQRLCDKQTKLQAPLQRNIAHSPLNKEEINSISHIPSPVEKACKSNINKMRNKRRRTVAGSISFNKEVTAAIKNIHSVRRNGCSSTRGTIKKNILTHSSLSKENIELPVTLPLAKESESAAIHSSGIDAHIKTENDYLDVKNVQTENIKECSISETYSKNNSQIPGNMKEDADELSNQSSSNKPQASEKSVNKTCNVCVVSDPLFVGIVKEPSLPRNDQKSAISKVSPIVRHSVPVDNIMASSLTHDSHMANKSNFSYLQPFNKLFEHETNQDDELPLSLTKDTELLEHDCQLRHNTGIQNSNMYKQVTISDFPLQDNRDLKKEGDSNKGNLLAKDSLETGLILSKEVDVLNTKSLTSLNDSVSSAQANIERGSFDNNSGKEMCKVTSPDSISEYRTIETVQSLFDIQVSSYLSPSSENFFNSEMDVWDGVVWEKTYTKHVLYHGNQILHPLETIASGPFTVLLIKRLQELNFLGPTCIQKLVWPALFRGRNIVAVAPSSSGKSLAYLLPLASQLIEHEQYSGFAGNEGPLVVILCSNWKKAQTVYNQCKILLQNCDICVNVVYSGGYETSQKIRLLNGCKILIITPTSYIHLQKEDKRLVNMNQCCHLVFDDADKIFDKFLTDVYEITKEFFYAVSHRKKSFLPNQLVLCSEHWSKQISSFVHNCIPHPLIIMISFDEASIYSQVPTFCHIESVSTSSLLLKLFRTCEMKKTIICTQYVKTAMKIYKLLSSLALKTKTLIAHENLTEKEVNEISNEWRQYHETGESIILVSTDDLILQLNIKNANCLIHYDLPKLPNFHFGLRYSFMSSNFLTLKEIFSGKVSDCVCHVFIQKNSHTLSNTLLKYLRQLPCEIPDDLVLLTKKFKDEEKHHKSSQLCHYFKAYGLCPSLQMCTYRHRIDQDIDGVTYVPRYGEVKIFITNVIDATHYYARIMEHSDPYCTLNCVSYLSLSLKMSDYYGMVNCIHPKEIKVYTLYGIQKAENSFHRVWVMRFGNTDTTGNPKTVFIFYVDEGWCEEVIAENFFILPPELARFPAQAIEIYACNVQPVDKGYEWTPQASMFIHNIINGKEVEGKVVLGLHNTLWLDPVVYYVHLKISSLTIAEAVISDVIIKKGFGIKNSDHLTKLYSACSRVISFPEAKTNSDIQEYQYAFLDLNKFHDVYIYSAHTPDLFYVQRTDFIECMDSISDKLDKMIRKGMLKKPKRIAKNMICAAPFAGENSWFRASVNYVDIDNGQVDLFFVDYGDTNVASIEDIYCLPSELLLLPFQAIECSLAGIVPFDCNWTNEAGKLLFSLCSNETTTIRMVARALKSKPSCFRKCKHYVIQLWDTTSDHSTFIADELVKQGMAIPYNLPDIFKNEMQEPESDGPVSEEEDCEKAFLDAIIYGRISDKINELIASADEKAKTYNNSKLRTEPDLLTSTHTACNNTIKYLTPKVQWYQTDETIDIHILVRNLTQYEFNVVGLNICFVATAQGNTYQFEEELFDFIQQDTPDAKVNDTSILFTLIKEKAGKWWPQLTKEINENIRLLEKKDTIEDEGSEISMYMPIIKWNSQDILPYDPFDEYEKGNLSEDDVPWEQVCLPLDHYDMLCWD